MPEQIFWGNMPVPYAAAWTGEDELFLGPCPYAGNATGLKAIRQVQARGVGKPTFGKPHMDRQREAIAHDLYDLCGKPLKNRTKVSLSQARPQPHAVNPGDVLQVEPLLHRECAAISVQHCPSLKGQIRDGVYHIRQVFRHACQFAIYSEEGTEIAVGVRVKSISHAKVQLIKWAERDLDWLQGSGSKA